MPSRERRTSARVAFPAKARTWPERVEALGLRAKVAGPLALFAVIVGIKASTGLDVSIRALYLLPVAAAAWGLGRRVGVAASVAAASVTLYFDLGSSFGESHRLFVYSDAATRFIVYLASTEILAQLREAHERVSELAEIDPLTGLYNRRGLHRMALREIARSKRTGAHMTAVTIDLDGFKSLNDRHGHAEGDDVLAAVGKVLWLSRASDVACRLGGDEFGLLLPDVGADAAVSTVERLVARLVEAMKARAWPITFSIGVATFDSPPATPAEVFAMADMLMYEVKRSGKDNVRYARVGRDATVVTVSRAPAPEEKP